MTDAISREETIDAVARIAKAKARSDAQKALCGRIIYYLQNADPVSDGSDRRVGHWIDEGFKIDPDVTFCNRSTWVKTYSCSECGSVVRGSIKNFCCDCGADMRGSEE